MTQPLSRRSLLVGAGSLAVLAACGKDKGNGNAEIKVPKSTTTSAGQQDVLSYVQAGSMYQSGINERVTFALFQGVPASLVGADAVVSVAFQKPGTKVLTDPVLAVRKSEGIEDRPYYVVHHEFDVAGNWGVRATIPGKQAGDAVLTVNDPAKVAWPVPGAPLPKIASPTPGNAMGVNPICTRSEGMCPFHAQSLDAVVGNGKPTVVLLATPALCQSATCGPVLDILMGEVAASASKLNVVHIEVYTDSTGKTAAPAFAAFHTDSEPAMFLANKSGVVVNRLNGPFDKSEARDAIAQLLA